jgi:redox-sensitive bicupin YhaK (pirin superfamily)
MSNLAPTTTAERCASEPTAPVLEALAGRPSDLGGLPIRRLLPRSQRRLVGPWCFLDRFGPLAFSAGSPMDVPPHPHIGLQTVSWLLEGEVLHRDSLGNECTIRAGELNLMTSGAAIAHSEETPRRNSGLLNGVQLWVALPDAERHHTPSFDHYEELPRVDLGGGAATLIIGDLGAARSPARAFSDIIGADVIVRGKVTFPLRNDFEHALFLLDGSGTIEGQPVVPDVLYYLGTSRDEIALSGSARALLLGGAPFGESILMWWNFVARTHEEIAAAREEWEIGQRFGAVRGYAGPRLRAPALSGRAVPNPAS